MRMSKMKKWKKIVLICTGTLIIAIIGFGLLVTDGLSEGMRVSIEGVDLSNIPDGSYIGSYEFKRWSNSVIVHVSDNRITGIEMHEDVFGATVTDAFGDIVDRVILAQDTTVDAVSGATVTSKAYLKAIEDALTTQD